MLYGKRYADATGTATLYENKNVNLNDNGNEKGVESGDFDHLLFLSFFTHTLNRVLNLTNEEVYLQRRLSLLRL